MNILQFLKEINRMIIKGKSISVSIAEKQYTVHPNVNLKETPTQGSCNSQKLYI